ncbi:MAG: hypothetical protein Q4Q62_01985 [Thermoplasmata archaeon]|nr:hypothetical protein [Thermoplasmata archaeon]
MEEKKRPACCERKTDAAEAKKARGESAEKAHEPQMHWDGSGD